MPDVVFPARNVNGSFSTALPCLFEPQADKTELLLHQCNVKGSHSVTSWRGAASLTHPRSWSHYWRWLVSHIAMHWISSLQSTNLKLRLLTSYCGRGWLKWTGHCIQDPQWRRERVCSMFDVDLTDQPQVNLFSDSLHSWFFGCCKCSSQKSSKPFIFVMQCLAKNLLVLLPLDPGWQGVLDRSLHHALHALFVVGTGDIISSGWNTTRK